MHVQSISDAMHSLILSFCELPRLCNLVLYYKNASRPSFLVTGNSVRTVKPSMIGLLMFKSRANFMSVNSS